MKRLCFSFVLLCVPLLAASRVLAASPVAPLFSSGVATLLSDNSAEFHINRDADPNVTVGDILFTIVGISSISGVNIGSGTAYDEVTALSAVRIVSGPTNPHINFQGITVATYIGMPLDAADAAYFNWATGQIDLLGDGGAPDLTFPVFSGLTNDGKLFGIVLEDAGQNFDRDSTLQTGIGTATDGSLRLVVNVDPTVDPLDTIAVQAPVSVAAISILPPVTFIQATSIFIDATIAQQSWPGLNFNADFDGGNSGLSTSTASSQWPIFDNLDFTVTAVTYACGNGILDPGEQCDDGNQDNLDTCRNDCTLPVCGDGITDLGEACDDGNLDDTDGCRSDCTIPVCGDGITDAGEECDDGNLDETDGCHSNCTVARCGDGYLDQGEQCDDNNNVDGDGCQANCRNPICGDGILDAGEQCDDGNLINGDGCQADCMNAICGDGIVDAGEACDDGNAVNGDGCQADCSLPRCGDGTLDAGEECDDGNNVSGDGCQADCMLARCGDGIVDAGEACDDGNNVSGDGCQADCSLPRCGDGIVDPGEQCDDGNTVNGDNCQADCTLPFCGDGIVDPGEACDDGNTVNGDGCQADCSLPRCGDGTLDSGEQCDDGNTVDGDGCQANCMLARCGDGIVDAGEACDDGNNASGDGCQADCSLPRCGDGVVDSGEQCDDGNTIDGDGCQASCMLPQCGDGILDMTEQCDDGNTTDGDGCSANCTVETCNLTVVKTASPEVVDCTAVPPVAGECGCEGKVTELTLRYNGAAPAFVTIQQKKDGHVVFSATVAPGEVFSFIGTDKNWTFGTEIQIYVSGTLHTTIHTSCSQPIGPGLVRGDFVVVDGSSKTGGKLCPITSTPSTSYDTDSGVDTNHDGDSDSEAAASSNCTGGHTDTDSGVDTNHDGDSDSEAAASSNCTGGHTDTDSGVDTNHDGDSDSEAAGGGCTPPPTPGCNAQNVTYTYVVTNNGPPMTNVQVVDDKLGVIATLPALATGESQTVSKVGSVCATTTNTVTVTGSLASGAVCEASDTATVTCKETPPEEPCGCEGKVTTLTLRYHGTAAAVVRVEEKDDTVVFEGNVAPGASFSFTGTDKFGTLGTEIEIYVNGVLQTKIHTSCSQPIGPGLIRGDFEVVDGASRGFSLLCPVESPCGSTGTGSDSGEDSNHDGDSDSEALPGHLNSDSGIDANHDGDSDSEATLSGCPKSDGDSGEDSNHDGDSDSEEVTPPTPPAPPADDTGHSCDGKVTHLTLHYHGATACFVEVQQKKGKRVYTGHVRPGDEINLVGANKDGTLGTEITLYVEGKFHTKIDTSCAQPIGPGLERGDFEVVDGASRNGGKLCPLKK